jgi:hypothetical protein
MEKYKEQIEKEANEYAYAFGNGIYSDGLYKGFVDSFNSKISERIKIEFTLKILEELKQESPFPNYVPHQYINNKITELKNRIK